jgi:hypothetical protein
MHKDARYETIKFLIEDKRITELGQIFNHITKYVIAQDLGIGYKRMSRLVDEMIEFTAEELFTLSELIGIPYSKVMDLVYVHYKRKKKKVS